MSNARSIYLLNVCQMNHEFMRFGLYTQQMFTQLTSYHSAVFCKLLEAEDDSVFFPCNRSQQKQNMS